MRKFEKIIRIFKIVSPLFSPSKMKNLSPRQRKILDALTQKGDLTMQEIRALSGVSQATAYREIQALTARGLAEKTPGGISLPAPAADLCLHCRRPVNPRLVFHIHLADGARRSACCAHCGLLALGVLDSSRQAITTDFLHGSLLNAAQAWYVLESSVSPCCRPSALAFASQADAERFAAAFGGQVHDFHAALTELSRRMNLTLL